MHEPVLDPIVVMTFHRMEGFILVDVLLGEDLQVRAEFAYTDPDSVPLSSEVFIQPMSNPLSVTTTATGQRWVSFIVAPDDARLAKLMAGDIEGFWKLLGLPVADTPGSPV